MENPASSRRRKKLLHTLFTEQGSPVRLTNATRLRTEANKTQNGSQKKITTAEVQWFLESNKVWQLHKQSKRKIQRLKTRAVYLNQTWSADLVDMQKFSRNNEGNRYILTSIDLLSRKGFAAPIKSKAPKCVLEGFKTFLKEMKRQPDNVHSGNRKLLFTNTDL